MTITVFNEFVTFMQRAQNRKLNLTMAILNIDQFIERTNETLVNCERCRCLMQQAPISYSDALKVIFGSKKIKGRMKCPDCQNETTIEWKNGSSEKES